jgi:hypothetical protein
MKSYRKELWFEVPTRRAFINITPEVERCLRESGICFLAREISDRLRSPEEQWRTRTKVVPTGSTDLQ